MIRTYFVPNSELLDYTIQRLNNTILCKVNREFVEMDYSKVTVFIREKAFSNTIDYIFNRL